MYTVIGWAHRVGEYQGKQYDNMVFSCLRPADELKQEQGQIAEVFKVKTSALTDPIHVGDQIRPIFNRFGQIDGIDVL